MGLILEPLFDKLGYETKIEYDLSKKQQFIDVIAVKKKADAPIEYDLPEDYWKNFGELNDHNLISFKSYSESFNGFALLELFGHYISYLKECEADPNSVNLYAITNHFPKKLLDPFKEAGFVKEFEDSQSIILHIPGLKPVRFLLTRNTSNPVLQLFSGKREKIVSAYKELEQRTDLLNRISGYFQEIVQYYDDEVNEMYTKEDFFRDHPDHSQPYFRFPWEKEQYEKDLKNSRKAGEDKGIIKGKKEGVLEGQIKYLRGLYQDGLLSEEEYLKRTALLQEQLESLLSENQEDE